MVEAQVLTAWLTPTYLFVFLNIILAIIFLNHSKNSKNNHHPHQDSAVTSTASQPHSHSHPQLTRTPSLLSRVASFNFSHYYHSESSHVVAPYPETSVTSTAEAAVVNHPPAVETVAGAPSFLYRVASFKFRWTPPSEVINSEGKKVKEQEEVEVARESHGRRENEEKKVEVKKKAVKKKKVEKDEVADVAKTTAFKREDEEVDSKADDFINKFKQQLKLQRIESLLRFGNNDSTSAY